MNLILYSTSACHLCEQAKELLWPLLENQAIRLSEIDIAESDELLERYGVRIPVYKFSHRQEELAWPFDTTQLQNFLGRAAASEIT